MHDENGDERGTVPREAHTVKMRPAVRASEKNADSGDTIKSSVGAAVDADVNDKYRSASVNDDIPDDDADESDESEEKDINRHVNGVTGAIVGTIKGIVYLMFIIVVGVALALFVVIPIGNDVFALVKDDEVVDVTVPEAATLNDIADLLYENGLISYPIIFKLYAQFTENENDPDYGIFVAGDYSLSKTLNYGQFIDAFKPTHDVEQISITIPEGMTTKEIIDLFVENGIGTEEGFVEAINNYDWSDDFNYWFIDELEENGWSEDRYYRLDGYLFPDTYYFFTDSSEVLAISKLLDNFEVKFTDEFRDYVHSKGMTVDQAMILASMVEAEAGGQAEFPLVSSVFDNRLKNSASYPYLESDATIMYAMFNDMGERPDTLTGTEYDSPYNTYKYRGLPPGPICNPGTAAITYAIYPRATDYFYFVANNDGLSVFSETLAEHNQAIEDIKNGVAVSTIFAGGSGSSEYQEDDEEEEDYE